MIDILNVTTIATHPIQLTSNDYNKYNNVLKIFENNNR